MDATRKQTLAKACEVIVERLRERLSHEFPFLTTEAGAEILSAVRTILETAILKDEKPSNSIVLQPHGHSNDKIRTFSFENADIIESFLYRGYPHGKKVVRVEEAARCIFNAVDTGLCNEADAMDAAKTAHAAVDFVAEGVEYVRACLRRDFPFLRTEAVSEILAVIRTIFESVVLRRDEFTNTIQLQRTGRSTREIRAFCFDVKEFLRLFLTHSCPYHLDADTIVASYRSMSKALENGLCNHVDQMEAALARCDIFCLPPELRDMIYEMALGLDEEEPQKIISSKKTKLPTLLHASRQVRTEAATVYFGKNTFKCSFGIVDLLNTDKVRAIPRDWFLMIGQEQARMIRCFRVVLKGVYMSREYLPSKRGLMRRMGVMGAMDMDKFHVELVLDGDEVVVLEDE